MDVTQIGQGVSQETIQKALEILSGPAQKWLPGVGITKDVTTATGLVAYNLEPTAKLLVPALTPLRNMIPRIANTRGGTAVNWKVITALPTATDGTTDPFTAEGTKASTITYTVTPKSAAFATISKGDNVSMQAQWAGKTFEDVRAKASMTLLRTVMILEEQAILGGRVAVLTAPDSPTCSSAHDGAIADGTYYVTVRAETMLGRGIKCVANTAVVLAATNNDWSISAHVPWVEGATRYLWYVGTANNTTTGHLEATTYINSVKLTALAATGVAQAANNSANANAFDGIIAQLTAATAQVTTLATGTDGTGTAFALSDVNTMLKNIWDNARGNPDVLFMQSQQSLDLTNKVLAANGAPTFFVNQDAAKAAIQAGWRVSSFLNPITGKAIPVVVHPYMDPGLILALQMEAPFSVESIENTMEIETRQDYLMLDYPMVKPAWEFEVLVDEVLKVYFPSACGIIRNIAAG
jgi:hypothetical protein